MFRLFVRMYHMCMYWILDASTCTLYACYASASLSLVISRIVVSHPNYYYWLLFFILSAVLEYLIL